MHIRILVGLILLGGGILLAFLRSYIQYRTSAYFRAMHRAYFLVRLNKGRWGEYSTYQALRPLKGYKRFLFNCYIPRPDGSTTEVDMILLHESGIYVLESKNFRGRIFGNEDQRRWVQSIPLGKGRVHNSYFFNPVRQNQAHLRGLKQYLQNGRRLPFFSYVVFGNHCKLKQVRVRSQVHRVLRRKELLRAVESNIRSMGNSLNKQQIDGLYRYLWPLTQVSRRQKRKHVRQLQKKYKR